MKPRPQAWLKLSSVLQTAETPAFIYSEPDLHSAANDLLQMCHEHDVKYWFPLKCHSTAGSLEIIASLADGLAASSSFEARLARDILGEAGTVHLTSPGLRDDEFNTVLTLCNGISFNSLSQWARYKTAALGRVTCGLRVNPQLSFVEDPRYNPSTVGSRLGAPLDQVKHVMATEPHVLGEIQGIHFHTNCDSTTWSPLLESVRHLDKHISDLLAQCRWVNLGGGYLLEGRTGLEDFKEAANLLHQKYGLDVIIEPGAGLVRDACVLVSQVVDVFALKGEQIAILDTSVNHMPEVFEYQFSPDVIGDTEDGKHCYTLTGATCLAGDIFGEYAFDHPLEVGAKVTFTGVGAYTLVKSHMFNGVNLPAIYALTAAGNLQLQRRYNYEDFRDRLGHTKT